MEKVINFIVENHEILILLAACLLDVVLFLVGVFRRKTDPSLNSVLKELPRLIFHAECKFGAGHGEEKKKYVLDVALKLYKNWTGFDISEKSFAYHVLGEAVEEILCTPEKKKGK